MDNPKFKKGDRLNYLSENPFNHRKIEQQTLIVESVHKVNLPEPYAYFRYVGKCLEMNNMEQWIDEEELYYEE